MHCYTKVCANVARCYAVASLFGSCREKIQEMPSVVKDLCRILYYKVFLCDISHFERRMT